MIISADETQRIMRAWAPELKDDWQVFPVDKRTELLTPPDLRKVVDAMSVAHNEYIPEVYDCDDFAIDLYQNIRNLRRSLVLKYPEKINSVPWNIGFAVGMHNWVGMHLTDVAITTEGVRSILPQTDTIEDKYDGQLLFTFF